MVDIDRRAFLRRSAIAIGGAAAFGGLSGLLPRVFAQGLDPVGYGALINRGELWLPPGFSYAMIQTTADVLTNGDPVPTKFDGMAAFPGSDGNTILIRNHENNTPANQVGVNVPPDKMYDPIMKGGVTKLVVDPEHNVIQSYALLGGTLLMCAGGVMPWGSWITCEEGFETTGVRHGYIFEVDPNAPGPVDPVPIRRAGRFQHEAVVWYDGYLYETEDRGDSQNAFYRFQPSAPPQAPGDLADNGGTLWALRVIGQPGIALSETPQGTMYDIDWVQVPNPDPNNDGPGSTRQQAWALGAARFHKSEGMALKDGKIYFNGSGAAGTSNAGHIWELDPAAGKLKMFLDSTDPRTLNSPDNMTFSPTGDLLVCEDNGAPTPIYVRGVRMSDAKPYNLLKAGVHRREFAGACMDPNGKTLYVNQMGMPGQGIAGVTYAVWGPWHRDVGPSLSDQNPVAEILPTETPSPTPTPGG